MNGNQQQLDNEKKQLVESFFVRAFEEAKKHGIHINFKCPNKILYRITQERVIYEKGEVC